ncbi:ciliary microtubule-associated protein 2-like isoform X2 [Engraulis encrasicolus]|uniref:ciliary microtubule-associated protein 2-like isoform X2 n=1 Tax=Engraulis encrasicolus TaxID=184585 RepID=UPI002FD36E64
MVQQTEAESLGPGKYDLKTFTDVLNMKPCSVRGVCNSREERLKDYRKICPAGPGSYGKGGVPAALFEERSMKSTGNVCPMDFSAGVERFRDEPVDCGLYPGTYKIKSCIEQVLDHHVGKRGPFDIFSGRRDKPINYGYLAAPRIACINPSYYLPPMFGEDLKTAQKRFHGVFSQKERFPSVPAERIYRHTLAQRPEAVDKPGPGHYSITELTRVENRDPPPFLSSSHRFSKRIGKQPQGTCCNVGPGRYGSPKALKIHKRDSAAFKSETPRYLANMDQDTFGQEKLRPCNIPDIWRPYNRHPDEALKCPL